MTNQHPITPPPELRRQWLDNDDFPFVAGTNDLLSIAKDRLNSVMDQAAQWGADQELEACVNYIDNNISGNKAREFRAIRRPKPPSRKEQALEAIGRLCASVIHDDLKNDAATIRRALEALDD